VAVIKVICQPGMPPVMVVWGGDLGWDLIDRAGYVPQRQRRVLAPAWRQLQVVVPA
jgi:hypothetical protein